MARFIPVNPMLQKMAPSLDLRGQEMFDVTTTGQVGPDLERDYRGVSVDQAVPGLNVPMPEPVQIRNRQLPPPEPPVMTDALPAIQQRMDFADDVGDMIPGAPTPFDPGYEETYGRPMDLFEQRDLNEADNLGFARFAPQVDAIYGLSSFRPRRAQTPFA